MQAKEIKRIGQADLLANPIRIQPNGTRSQLQKLIKRSPFSPKIQEVSLVQPEQSCS